MGKESGADIERGEDQANDQPVISQATTDSVLDQIAGDMPSPSPIADRPANLTPTDSVDQPVKRKPGRPRKNPSDPAKPKNPPPLVGVAAAGQGASEPNPHAAAAQCAIMLAVMPATLLAGEGGVPEAAEVRNMQGAFEVYFKEKGIDAVPAWVLVAGALIPFYARVIVQEKAKSKFTRVIDAVKGVFKRKRKPAIDTENVA